jgi:hypothetical protein
MAFVLAAVLGPPLTPSVRQVDRACFKPASLRWPLASMVVAPLMRSFHVPSGCSTKTTCCSSRPWRSCRHLRYRNRAVHRDRQLPPRARSLGLEGRCVLLARYNAHVAIGAAEQQIDRRARRLRFVMLRAAAWVEGYVQREAQIGRQGTGGGPVVGSEQCNRAALEKPTMPMRLASMRGWFASAFSAAKASSSIPSPETARYEPLQALALFRSPLDPMRQTRRGRDSSLTIEPASSSKL